MSRGDRREDIFLDDADRQDFLKTVAEACVSGGPLWCGGKRSATPLWLGQRPASRASRAAESAVAASLCRRAPDDRFVNGPARPWERLLKKLASAGQKSLIRGEPEPFTECKQATVNNKAHH